MDNKNLILSLLKKRPEQWVSGGELSVSLGLSRTAVWKHIRALRAEGYLIGSSTKKGYRFLGSPDLLSGAEVTAGLNTRVFGKTGYHHLNETGSTNDVAAGLAGRGAPEGTVAAAETQTGGRGRRGRSWFSPAGKGIYFSIILRPAVSPAEAPKITLLAAVAAAETLRGLTGLDVRIKWPNDLLVGGKKIAGILTEMSAGMETVNHVILGIGLNINTAPKAFPGDIRGTATSVRAETGKNFSRPPVLRALLESLEHHYDMFLAGGFPGILARWKELSMIIGNNIRVEGINSSVDGTAVGIDDDGALLLKDGHGTVHRIISGDLVFSR